ncbi:glycoside hydrolase family 13 protein [Flavobacterium litorale]|uniref:Glycoside hydrolase family 13 protein n=1 Tax=Flavobacterium litorale TaxID=2856519 RepID=A0ABX8V950_9FLAO|nr:glycoside hydrolase family 13 protein [Flavobacterium litorale]QYJ68663.1 glycoside hydrolase family 13 protein [Flavobacterium litorale]
MKKIVYILLLICSTAVAQIERVEPPFWWSGMHNPELQILLYGADITRYTPTLSDTTIIKEVFFTENPNYIFITINTKNLPATDLVFTFKDKLNQKPAFTHTYSLKQRDSNSAQRESFNSSDLVYLIMPDRFANGNPDNDSSNKVIEKANRNLPSGRHGGDIAGIIQHLDYLEELGVTALWSTPFCEDNDAKTSYHGYAQSDVYKIDPRYGTNEEYKQLAAEMKKRGMKLIMDYVTNHWGAQHPMYKDLPFYDWIHQFPGYSQSNYRMTTQFDPNASKIDAKNCMDGWFVSSMPDLNQSEPLVLNYLIQNAIWWIEYADLGGLRVDTYSYNDKEGIAKWTKGITDEYPNFNIVGEVWMHDQAQIAYWQKDSKIAAIQNYNSHLPSVMDFTLHDAIGSVFNEDNSTWNDGMIKVYENFVDDFLYPDINNILVFIENHDTARFNEIYKNDFDKYKMAITLIATIRGIPQLYYGTEIGMAGDKGKGDADIRRDFPGGWAGDTNNAFTKKGRTAEQQKWFAFTSKLFNWRKNKAVIHTGKTTHYLPENNVYVYFRHNTTDAVMVLLNNSTQPQTVTTSRFAENLKGYTKGKNILNNKTIPITNAISIPPKSAIVLELQ